MKTFVKINKWMNGIFIDVVLLFFYFIVFGVSKIIFLTTRKIDHQKNSYWKTIQNQKDIDYQIGY